MPKAPRMKKGESDFWEEVLLPYLNKVKSGHYIKNGQLKEMGDAVRSGDYGEAATHMMPGGGFGITKIPDEVWKKFPWLWHGVKGGKEDKRKILKEGFTQGKSAEMGRKGTSSTYDPLISARTFSPPYDPYMAPNPKSAGKPDYFKEFMLRTRPVDKPAGLLDPAEYILGMTPPTPESYFKPQSFFGESELFTQRPMAGPAPLRYRDITDREAEYVAELNKKYQAVHHTMKYEPKPYKGFWKDLKDIKRNSPSMFRGSGGDRLNELSLLKYINEHTNKGGDVLKDMEDFYYKNLDSYESLKKELKSYARNADAHLYKHLLNADNPRHSAKYNLQYPDKIRKTAVEFNKRTREKESLFRKTMRLIEEAEEKK